MLKLESRGHSLPQYPHTSWLGLYLGKAGDATLNQGWQTLIKSPFCLCHGIITLLLFTNGYYRFLYDLFFFLHTKPASLAFHSAEEMKKMFEGIKRQREELCGR